MVNQNNMNELLSSGLVGNNQGTTEEIIKRWQSFGFIEVCNDPNYDYSEACATLLEEMASYLITNYDSFSNEKTDTISLVVMGRISLKFQKQEWTEGFINDFIEQVDIKEVVDFVDQNSEYFTNFVCGQKYSKFLDCEALSYSFISDIIIEQIIAKVKLSKEFYNQFLFFPSSENKEILSQMAQEIGVEMDGSYPKNQEEYKKLETEYIRRKLA